MKIHVGVLGSCGSFNPTILALSSTERSPFPECFLISSCKRYFNKLKSVQDLLETIMTRDNWVAIFE